MGWQLTRDVIKCYLCCIIHQFPNMYPAIIQILIQWNLKFFITNRGDAHRIRVLPHWEQNRNTDFLCKLMASVLLYLATWSLNSKHKTVSCLWTRKLPLATTLIKDSSRHYSFLNSENRNVVNLNISPA